MQAWRPRRQSVRQQVGDVRGDVFGGGQQGGEMGHILLRKVVIERFPPPNVSTSCCSIGRSQNHAGYAGIDRAAQTVDNRAE